MKDLNSEKTFTSFVDAINEHDIDRIDSLMAEDHVFIDSHGNEIAGKDKMKPGWIGYFHWFPDYKIEIVDMLSHGVTVAAFGFASGTYGGTSNDDDHWRLPAAWKAIVHEGKISLWQVYADTHIPFVIIEKNTVN